MRLRLFDNPNDAWENFGRDNAYYAVVTHAEFQRESLSQANLEKFFKSGDVHVERVFEDIDALADNFVYGSCLDFGCGVGRLAIPFARRFQRVVGVDVSRSMLDIAQQNAANAQLTNIEFARDLDGADGSFDLVHTYIVLQHMEVAAGLRAIKRLFALARPGGVCWIQLTFGKSGATPWYMKLRPGHFLLNAIRGRHFSAPMMQMNSYPLAELLEWLGDQGVTALKVELERHGKAAPAGACLVFQKPNS